MRNLLIAVVFIFLAVQSNLAQQPIGSDANFRGEQRRVPGLQYPAGRQIFEGGSQHNIAGSAHLLRRSEPQNLKLGVLEYRVPFSAIFKYDTSRNNPEHRCYDIRKPLTKKYTFLFNFLSSQQYAGMGAL